MSLLLLKKPHGGPITHSSTGSKPDTPVHPLFPKLFLACGLVCNSRATVLVIYSGNIHNIQSRCFGPLSHVVSDIERLPIRLKLLMVPSYFALDIFLSFDSRDTYASSDVGRNPMGTIFHVWSGSYEETRTTRGRTQGKTRGETRENTQPTSSRSHKG